MGNNNRLILFLDLHNFQKLPAG